jgi:hypothetical protein
MNIDKNDAKKKALKAAIKKELRPFMVELGFAPDKRPHEERVSAKIGLYVRIRDGHTDELLILWSNYGRPLFMIEFWTSEVELMQASARRPPAHPLKSGRIYPRRFGRFHLFAGEPWYGREKTVEATMAVAKARLVELDGFLRTGLLTPHLWWEKRLGDQRMRG